MTRLGHDSSRPVVLMPALDAEPPEPIRVDRILGSHTDAALHERLHHLAHHGWLDVLRLPAADLPRHRVQARTEGGAAGADQPAAQPEA